MVKRAKEQGCTALALTDNDAMYGTVEFYRACQAEGIKPIIGLDVHVAPEHRSLKRARIDKKSWRMVLLATGDEGYKNLLELSSLGFLEGFYYTARIDDELLEKYHRGLIALSGGIGGEIPSLLLSGRRDTAIERAKFYSDLFGEGNFYIELVHRPDSAEQESTNNMLKELAGDLGLPMVATSNSFYLDSDDHEAWEALQCIQKGRTLEENRRGGVDVDLSLATPDELKEAFKDVPEALENTNKIAERCNLEIELDNNYLPVFEMPEGKTDSEYLRELCEEGLRERYETITDAIKERFEYEFGVISKMEYSSYFLIVYDFVRFAKENGILVGPGRGSAAGSIIAYALKITDVDPLKYGLLFERFLNPDRVSMPDIDMDFADSRRAEVLEYVRDKYGSDHVAGIITFGTLMPRAAVRDAARVLGLNFQDSDRIAKLIPPPVQGRHTPLPIAIKEHTELRNDYQGNSLTRQVIDLAIKIEGTPRHTSQHACGVVISDKPLTKYVPIQESQHDDLDYVSQFSLNSVEAAGLVKMDFLGLSNLTIIERALEIIKAVRGVDIDIEKLPLDDEETFKLLGRGETVGVFQLESEGMQRYLSELKPSVFEDIMAMCALYRPGPLSAGMVPMYINRKHGKQKVTYDHPLMKDILEETYGVTVFQEQIMKLSVKLAGFTGGEADTLRKAMGKKKRDVLAKMKTKFIDGCKKTGLTAKVAQKIWTDWEGFADYAFNKSHTACYGMIAYQTAYLKAHYPAEFMAAVMNSDSGNIDRMTIEVNECRRIGIEVLPPDVNESFKGFGVVGNEKKIRWGLVAIKNVGEEVSKSIVAERKENGPYKDMSDFVSRVQTKHLNKKSIEALIMVGAFDAFEERGKLLSNMEQIVRFHKLISNEANSNQGSLFATVPSLGVDELKLKESRVAPRTERLAWEKELLGIYVTEHPYTSYAPRLSKYIVQVGDVEQKSDGDFIKTGGVVAAIREIVTKKGDQMAFVRFEDGENDVEAVFFPRVYAGHKIHIKEGVTMIISGKVSVREAQPKSILVDSLVVFDESSFDEVLGMLTRGVWVDEGVHQQVKTQEREHELSASIEGTSVVIVMNGAPTPLQITNLRQVFTKRPGDASVQFAVESGGRIKRIKTEFSIAPTNAVIDSIGQIIGNENVKVVENGQMS